ncbi:hypothetical protein AOT82_2020 [Psychrobacter sp. AntiMn-1]|nr:hypothetical protein AOT82_2020 [Psychrobacter sp. AntiMn-1]
MWHGQVIINIASGNIASGFLVRIYYQNLLIVTPIVLASM